MKNKHIYKTEDYGYYYDQQYHRDTGRIFEFDVRSELCKYLSNTPKIKLWDQLTINHAHRPDLVLFWKDINRNRRAIVIECKHSGSKNKSQRNRQIRNGIEQLYRYRECLELYRNWRVDLLVVCTSFPLDNGFPAQFINNVLVINCHSMLKVFANEVNRFYETTITPKPTI